MASYPTAVKTFSAKADGAGNIIYAAHINDIQDEVNAIESGILNGSAPLASSNTTHATLSVTGASTLATLTVTGASTVGSLTAGNATVSSNLTVNGLIRSTGQTLCQVYSGSTHSIANAAWTNIPWDSEELDVGGMHSTAANSSRVTVPTGSSGIYFVHSACRMHANTSGAVGLRILKNDTVEMAAMSFVPTGAARMTPAVTLLASMNATDFVTVEVYQDSGSTSGFGSTESRSLQPYLSVLRVC